MKFFSRDFTRTEKLLILVLVLILLALFYYQFVDKNVRSSLANAKSEAQMLETEIATAQASALRLKSLKEKMDALEAEGRLSWMGSYNNSKAEVAYLNEILADTLSYSIEFADVTRTGQQIRRSFKLRYQTAGFAVARDIMDKLQDGDDRCLVGDVKCSIDVNGIASMEASATFYETMVGGTPDAALPADKAAANS